MLRVNPKSLFTCLCVRATCLKVPMGAKEGARSCGVGVGSTCGSAEGGAGVGWELSLTVDPLLQPLSLAHGLKLATSKHGSISIVNHIKTGAVHSYLNFLQLSILFLCVTSMCHST